MHQSTTDSRVSTTIDVRWDASAPGQGVMLPRVSARLERCAVGRVMPRVHVSLAQCKAVGALGKREGAATSVNGADSPGENASNGKYAVVAPDKMAKRDLSQAKDISTDTDNTNNNNTNNENKKGDGNDTKHDPSNAPVCMLPECPKVCGQQTRRLKAKNKPKFRHGASSGFHFCSPKHARLYFKRERKHVGLG